MIRLESKLRKKKKGENGKFDKIRQQLSIMI